MRSSAIVSTVLALIIGLLTLGTSTALLYSTWTDTAGVSTGAQMSTLAVFGICGLGFATLSGYMVGLLARRAPVAHAAALSLILIAAWGASTVWDMTVLGGPDQSLVAALNLAIALTGTMVGGWLRSTQMQE